MENNRLKAVMPFSGGMDSAVMLRQAQYSHDELHLITFDYGQRHLREIECAKRQVEHAKLFSFTRGFDTDIIHNIVDVKFIKGITSTSSLTNTSIDNPNVADMIGEAQPASYVPFRNQLFLTIACMYAESINASIVYHGATAVDSLAGYWDGSVEFKNSFNSLISLNRSNKIEVKCPLLQLNKCEIIQLGVENKVDFSETYTCYSGDEIADATTPSSSLRIKGFLDAGYIDPQKYKQDMTQMWVDHCCKPFPENQLITPRGVRG
jgi:7-cyano-7-deazaguanine synthase